jgi:hypothetical protein
MQRVDKDALVKRPVKPIEIEDEADNDDDAPPPMPQPEEKKEKPKRERKAPAQGLQRAAKHVKPASNEYVVKRIVKESKQGRKSMYLVEWKDYPNEKDWTWEPAANLKSNVVFEQWKKGQ